MPVILLTYNMYKAKGKFQRSDRVSPHVPQVVEIAGLTEHLLTECESKDQFRKCPRCSEAIPKAEYDQHVADSTCPRKYTSSTQGGPCCKTLSILQRNMVLLDT